MSPQLVSPSAPAAPTAERPRLLCLTPTKNEAWIVQRFLAAAGTWADDIVVADQRSTDATVSHLQEHPKVRLVHNTSPVFDENHRQRLLLDRARAVPTRGHRILIGLDADEALSANCTETAEWARLCSAPPGTILRFRWVNILPGFKEAWIPPQHSAFGFVDNGVEHNGCRIHSPRVPAPPGAPVIDFQDIVVLHFQYVSWERMASKQRWYQAWEYNQHRQKGPLDIFRQYHHMHGSWGNGELQPVRPEWLAAYERIDFRSLASEPVTWWDREIVQLLCEHGPARFRRIAIWDHDWNAVARSLGMQAPDLSDPRSRSEKLIHRLLARTQHKRANWGVRAFEKCLRLAGW